MKLHTRVCDILGIDKPIVLAGMGGASSPELAAAVSNAGGLGVLGAAACGPRQLKAWIDRTRELTDKPFGVDTLLPASVRRANYDTADGPKPAEQVPELRQFAGEFMERYDLEPIPDEESRRGGERDGPPLFTKAFFEAQMEVVVSERVPVYASGLGNPGPWMRDLRANGTQGDGRHRRRPPRDSGESIRARHHRCPRARRWRPQLAGGHAGVDSAGC